MTDAPDAVPERDAASVRPPDVPAGEVRAGAPDAGGGTGGSVAAAAGRRPGGPRAGRRARRPAEVDWDAVAALYASDDVSVGALAARFGISLSRLYREARGRGWPLRQPQLARAVAGRRAAGGRRAPTERAVLVARLFRAVERQIGQIEARLADAPDGADEREARTLAALTRTLELLIDLERRAAPAPDATAAETDIDAFRAELARRIAGLGDVGGA